jgi:hypothetical protein
MEIISLILALLSAILPPIIGHYTVKAKERRIHNEALTRRSLDELDAGVDRLRNDQPSM